MLGMSDSHISMNTTSSMERYVNNPVVLPGSAPREYSLTTANNDLFQQRVESWFPMDKELPKGILDEEKQDSEGGSSGRSGRSKGTDEEPSGSDVEENETGQARVGLDTRGSITATQSRSASQSRQGVDISSRKWFCCCCRHGPLSRDLDEFCCMEGCAHRRCGMCKAGGA